MSTPAGDNAFLHELELTVSTELTLAEAGPPEEEAIGTPVDQWLSDPADEQRYEVGLHNLLGAVEALEDPGFHPSSAGAPEAGETAPCTPAGRHRRTETEGW